MNNKAVSLSLMMAVLALFFVQSYVDSETQALKNKYGSDVLVLKAKRDIKEMQTIDETMVSLETVPKKLVEPNAITAPDAKDQKSQSDLRASLVGQVAMVPIKAGEQVTYNKITEPSLRTGLSPQVQPGKRAVSIPVNEVTSVAKLVKPGDRVDVVAVLDGGGGKSNRIAKTILQDAVVLAVGRQVTNNIPRVIERDNNSPTGSKMRSLTQDFSFTSVTLEVDPAQAQMLVLVQAQTEVPLALALRNNDDTEHGPMVGTLLDDVMAEDRARIQRGVANTRR